MYTSNGGSNWTSRSSGIQIGLNGLHFVNQNKGWTVGGNGTLYSTTNAGLNWILEQSQTTQDLNSIHSFDGDNAWAVGNIGIITTNYSAPTGLRSEIGVISDYKLEQNFPNPFNPSTEIMFSIASDEFVTLKVFNILGSEIVTLVNDDLNAGSYVVDFNGEGLTSGIYLYSISTNNFKSTRKMILTK
jgi:hypothetical protein